MKKNLRDIFLLAFGFNQEKVLLTHDSKKLYLVRLGDFDFYVYVDKHNYWNSTIYQHDNLKPTNTFKNLSFAERSQIMSELKYRHGV
jgi:hypothetical protein